MTSILPKIPLFWLGFIAGILMLAGWQAFVQGRMICFFIWIGHVWAVLFEEIRRPLRIIKKAISRKDIALDEHEKELS